MQQHYFIGIKTPVTFKKQSDFFNVKYQLGTTYKVIPHPEDLHVTLLYLGAISDNLLPFLKEKLFAIASRHPTFSMQVDGLSYFGTSTGPRVVYLSVEESEALSALQREIEHYVAKQFDRPISEHFIPHITIAKKRKTTDELLIQKEKISPIEVPIKSFSLFSVHPEKSPKYKIIEMFELGKINTH